jgi:DNA repair protein RadC
MSEEFHMLKDETLVYNIAGVACAYDGFENFVQKLSPKKRKQVLSVIELYKRSKKVEHTTIRQSKDIADIFFPILSDLKVEEFWILMLNQASRVIDKKRISIGGIDQTSADVRVILREALLASATQLVMVHNHPSGNPRAGDADRKLTQAVCSAAKTMRVNIIDHVIIGNGCFFSFCDEGLI